MYEYLVGDFLFLAIWLYLYNNRKDLRNAMWFSSCLCLPLAISDYFFIPDYWNPETLFGLKPGIESFLFAFCIGGISAALYKTYSGEKLKKMKKSNRHGSILLAVMFITMLLMNLIFKVDLIYDGHATMLLGGVTIMLLRRDLIKDSLCGGLLFLGLYFLILLSFEYILFPGIIERTWTLQNPLFPKVVGLPMEELLWALTFGLVWSPIYQVVENYR